MKKVNWTGLAISIVIAELTGALSALLSGDIGAVYRQLHQPPLSPPGWVFPAAWIILYALMGIAAYLVWNTPEEPSRKRTALWLYAVQLAVSFIWTPVFFRFQAFKAAVAVIGVLLVLIILAMIKMGHVHRAALWLMLPYLLWVCFAAYLTIGVAILN